MSRIKEFNLPDLGEGLTEGEILKWYVAVGDTVTLNQLIVEVETAKAAVEIPAKWAGRITRIFQGEGSTVAVGTPIIAIDTDPDAGDLPETPESGEPARTPVLVGYGPRTGTTRRRPRVDPGPETYRPAPNGRSPVTPAPTNHSGPAPALAKPPVRKFARDLGVDLHTLAGTGPHGSISREDVRAAAHREDAHASAHGTVATGVTTTGVTTTGVTATGVTATGAAHAASLPARFGPDREQRVPLRGVRKHMAEAVALSAFTAPHVTEFFTIDMTRSMRVLKRLAEQPQWRGVRLSPLLLVAKAVLVGIARYPLINSSWSDDADEIVVKEYVNLGIAAATDRGLLVPNIKDAGRLSLRELADALAALTKTAKDGRTPPADMTNGTFTITNVGVFGVDSGTPILPPGEAAILAFGAIRAMPWVHKGKVKPRQVSTLALSFDHRIVDGELGSKFLRDVGAFLTDPETSLLAWT